MLDKSSKAKLDKFMEAKKRNVSRLIYITYRYFNEWAQKQWEADGWGGMRPDHLRVISIIGIESVNNNELAKRAGVSKQAMSKMVMDLVEEGFVEIETDPNDSRAKIIGITPKGVDFLVYLGKCGKMFEAKYHDLIGKEKTEQLIDILSELTEALLAQDREAFWKKDAFKNRT